MNLAQHKKPYAYYQVERAITKGVLIIPKTCELCGNHENIMPHHWNGYDYPLDVWFICRSCNNILRGRHDGSMSKNDILGVFRDYYPTHIVAKKYGLTTNIVAWRVRNGLFPGSRKLTDFFPNGPKTKYDPWFIPKDLIEVQI